MICIGGLKTVISMNCAHFYIELLGRLLNFQVIGLKLKR